MCSYWFWPWLFPFDYQPLRLSDRNHGMPFLHLHPQPEFDPGLYRPGFPGPRRFFRHRVLRCGAHDETWAIVLAGASSVGASRGPGRVLDRAAHTSDAEGRILPSPRFASESSVSIVAGNWIELTGGYSGVVGIALPTPLSIPWIGRIGFQTMAAQYYLVLAFLLFTLLVMHRLVYSLVGLSFMAIRNNEILAEAVGINTFAVKVLSFVVGNFFAAMAGGLYASLVGSISPSTASIELTFNWLVYLLLGGAATLAGPIIGAFAIPVLMENLQFLEGYRLIIFGALLIAVIIYFPRGIMGAISDLRQKSARILVAKEGEKSAIAG